jgi:hypothetical protein
MKGRERANWEGWEGAREERLSRALSLITASPDYYIVTVRYPRFVFSRRLLLYCEFRSICTYVGVCVFLLRFYLVVVVGGSGACGLRVFIIFPQHNWEAGNTLRESWSWLRVLFSLSNAHPRIKNSTNVQESTVCRHAFEEKLSITCAFF